MALFRPTYRDPKTGQVKRSRIWWLKFSWRGELIRESTKHTNKRVAEQIEAARKTAMARGEVGIRDRKPVPTLKQFAERDFLPFIVSRFQDKPNTRAYYQLGVKNLTAHPPLANCCLESVTPELISGYVATRREAQLRVSSINRELEVLRRMLKLAVEWGTIEKVPPRVRMLPGAQHRDFVLSGQEEQRYVEAATDLGTGLVRAYEDALQGIRATQRGQQPIMPRDPFLLRDSATLLLECALRPEELYRLRWDEVRDGAIRVTHGKTLNAKRIIPLTALAFAVLEMRKEAGQGEWVFPAATKSGHAEQGTLRRQHDKVRTAVGLPTLVLYNFRHTCLTRWASVMDPYTLAYLAGHSDFATTRRYVHPNAETVREAMERAHRAKTGTRIGQSPEIPSLNAGSEPAAIQ
jgi:integrase